MIVFTTAYDEYAIRAFKANSIDYLLKPIDKERLGEALEKYEKLTSKFYKEFNKQGDILEILQNITNPAKKYRTRFLISGGRTNCLRCRWMILLISILKIK